MKADPSNTIVINLKSQPPDKRKGSTGSSDANPHSDCDVQMSSGEENIVAVQVDQCGGAAVLSQ